MGYASYLVWKNGGGVLPLSLYGVQLVLNLAWSPIFFRQHEIGYALLDITGMPCIPQYFAVFTYHCTLCKLSPSFLAAALLGVLGATIVEFHKVSPTASYLLLPYLAWSSYATALTANIYQNNPGVNLPPTAYSGRISGWECGS